MRKEDSVFKSIITSISRDRFNRHKQEQQHLEVISRIVAVEESTKQAHKRIDRLEREVHHDT